MSHSQGDEPIRSSAMPQWRRILCLVIGGGLLYSCYLFSQELYEARRIKEFMLAGLGLTGFIGPALVVSAIDPKRF